jgi:hypothetical protein
MDGSPIVVNTSFTVTTAQTASESGQIEMLGSTFGLFGGMLAVGMLLKSYVGGKVSDHQWTREDGWGVWLASKLGVVLPKGGSTSVPTLLPFCRSLGVNHKLFGLCYFREKDKYRGCHACSIACWTCASTTCANCFPCLILAWCYLRKRTGCAPSCKNMNDGNEHMLVAMRLRIAAFVALLLVSFALSITITGLSAVTAKQEALTQPLLCYNNVGAFVAANASDSREESVIPNYLSLRSLEGGLIVSAIDLIGSFAFASFNEGTALLAGNTESHWCMQTLLMAGNLAVGIIWVIRAFSIQKRTGAEFQLYISVFISAQLLSWLLIENFKHAMYWTLSSTVLVRCRRGSEHTSRVSDYRCSPISQQPRDGGPRNMSLQDPRDWRQMPQGWPGGNTSIQESHTDNPIQVNPFFR